MKKTTSSVIRIILGAPKTIPGLLSFAKGVQAALTANPKLFPAPVPPLVQFASDIAAFDAAETATQTRAPGTVEARDAKRAIVEQDLRKLRAYVQQVADADPTNAAVIAKEAGMAVGKVTSRNKAPLTAKPNKTTSGAVDVVAKATTVKGAHDWDVSTDGGKTYVPAPTTLQAKTTLTGLTPGQTVFVRHRAVTKTGPDAWSQPISIIVT